MIGRRTLIGAAVLFLPGLLLPGLALAEKPPGTPGRGPGQGAPGQGAPGQGAPGQGAGAPMNRGATQGTLKFHIGERERAHIRSYYANEFRSGNCPPGLAKRANGCAPPGLARQWALGRPLPRGLVYYDLPRALLLRLTPPDQGYKYVRVAADVLLIAIATLVVVDAVEDLAR